MAKCQHTINGLPDYKCEKKALRSEKYCIFHLFKAGQRNRLIKKFYYELRELHTKKDGNWVGFIFPEEFFLTDFKIDYHIDLSHSTFGKIDISQIDFSEQINLSSCQFLKAIDLSQIEFNSIFLCENSTFKGATKIFSTFKGRANFNHSDFHDRTSFLGSFDNTASFQSCTFRDSITFRGGMDITFNAGSVERARKSTRVRRLFNNEVGMQNVNFLCPDRVKFVGTDMSWLFLVGTDLKGVHLYDTIWFQQKLKRNGLYDEVFALKQSDKDYRNYILPQIESGYRKVRVALEENKDYSFASDFYIGEIEIRRKRKHIIKEHFLSIEAFYNALSLYGTSPLQAARMFLWFFLLHFLISFFLYQASSNHPIFDFYSFESLKTVLNEVLPYGINSLKILTLQHFGNFIENGLFQSLIDTIFRIIGPIQIALLVMALRNKIKRN